MNAERRKSKKDKNIFIFSIIVFLYFALVIFLYEIGYDAVLIRFVIELFTIPFAALLIVLLVLSILSFIVGKFKIVSLSFYSITILLLTML